MIADFDGDITNLFEEAPEYNVPILATRNMVLFPGVISPILIGRDISVNLVNKLKKNEKKHQMYKKN